MTILKLFLSTLFKLQSHLIGHFAYNIKFYNNSAEFQKIIAFIIMRAQDEQIVVTAGKFYFSDLQSFASALKSSLGYFTLIRSIYSCEN